MYSTRYPRHIVIKIEFPR